jgi:hypothetical protein
MPGVVFGASPHRSGDGGKGAPMLRGEKREADGFRRVRPRFRCADEHAASGARS